MLKCVSFLVKRPAECVQIVITWQLCGKVVDQKVVIWEFSFFLLSSKKEWALVYNPETLGLHSAACCTYCSKELDL